MGVHHRLVHPIPRHETLTHPLASLRHAAPFDYIIVGGGTSGCLLASRLSSRPSRPRILVVEAGAEAEDDPENLIPGLVVPKFGQARGNWLYKTAAQRALDGRRIVYPRGRGMGGSSAVNFSSWVRGARCDWDEWAERVGDEWWRWENVVEYMKGLEDFHDECPPGMEKYVKPVEGMHGSGGPVGVGWGAEWQGLVEHCVKAAMEAGHELNLDHNDGDEMGVSVAQMNVDYGERRSSAAAFLGPATRSGLENLSVITKTLCKRVLFDGKRATGVELLPLDIEDGPDDPVTVHASKEVILCAGTFETPHILLLSGIGPPSALQTHSIPLVHASPFVGQNIKDHTAFSLEATISPSIPGHNQLLRSPAALSAAHAQYAHDKTGPLAVFGASAAMLFTRIPSLYTSAEFLTLPTPTQSFLAHPSRPSTELWLHGGPLFFQGATSPEDSILAIEGLCQNLLSRGSLTLQSADPRHAPLIDPAYCAEAYDWRVAVETVKVQLRLLQTAAMRAIVRQPLHGPGTRDAEGRLTLCEPEDEEAIREFLRAELTQGFHSLGSCVMGREEDEERVVDAQFRVLGVEGLRVADMSVCPILTNNHTQINAYLIAERCAQLLEQ